MAAKKKPTLAEAFKSAKESSDSKKPDPSDKKPTSMADVRMAEERLETKGTTLIPVVVRKLDANGKTIYQKPDEKETSKIIALNEDIGSEVFRIVDGKLQARFNNKELEGLDFLNEKAVVKPKEDGTYSVNPGKLAFIYNGVDTDLKGYRTYPPGKPQKPGIEPFVRDNIKLIKDSTVVEKIQSGDLPAYAEKIGQKDFLLKTKPNMPKTQGAKDAYRRSAKRQIDNMEAMKEAMKGWVFKGNYT